MIDKSLKYNILDLKYSYIAGFFDGEGSIGVHKRGNLARAHLSIHVTNTDRNPLDFIVDVFGGNIYESHPQSKKHSTSYRWRLNGLPATCMLEKILPYLICKEERAVLGIESVYSDGKRQVEIADKMLMLNKRGGND